MNRNADQLHDLIGATRLRLRRHSPFFAALALFVDVRFTTEVPIAATDGRLIFFHPNGYGDLPPTERDAVFLHELLHAALLHPIRRGARDAHRFNIAADIVVNGMVATVENVSLPNGTIRDTSLEHLSVEEIYSLLQNKKEHKFALPMADLVIPGTIESDEESNGSATKESLGALHDLHDRSALEAHWKQAIQQSKVLASRQGQGNLAVGLTRHLGKIAEPQLDWRSMLWRYVVRTPTDFSGFDRRFIHQGLYIDHLEGERVQVFCCIDTSGSVDDALISMFLGELRGILSSYPMLECQLWYADAECYGPYLLDSLNDLPPPKGGGGTDFRPFFEAVAEVWSGDVEAVCVYLTDGYGDFPSQPPELPALWVICPGGLLADAVPFGEVCRLI
jgi:predicted metal-dependent peptidase